MRPSHELLINNFEVFLQIPLRLSTEEIDKFELPKTGWSRVNPKDDYLQRQRDYFHEFAARPIFGNSDGRDAEFTGYTKILGPKPKKKWQKTGPALDLVTIEGNSKETRPKKYSGQLTAVELRTTEGTSKSLGLSIFTIAIAVSQVQIADRPIVSIEDLDEVAWLDQPFTLADAQALLERIRRYAPRGREKKSDDPLQPPYDSLFLVSRSEYENTPSEQFPASVSFINSSINRLSDVYPWIKDFISPILLTSDAGGRLFGDDRAYAFALIDLKPLDQDGKTLSANTTMQEVSDADLFRIAEGDPPAPADRPDEWHYNPDFLKELKPTIFFDRHAPHPETRSDRSTRYVFTEHVAAMVTCSHGVPANFSGNLDLYYRHMHFMCVFELYALLGFSNRLTSAVKTHVDDGQAFSHELLGIRSAFLRFTHIHHFSNVSSQIQPQEMYVARVRTRSRFIART